MQFYLPVDNSTLAHKYSQRKHCDSVGEETLCNVALQCHSWHLASEGGKKGSSGVQLNDTLDVAGAHDS